MRNFKSLLSTLAVAALLAPTAIAEDGPTANVFKADMSNPDLAAVITSFQDVCLPFIMHKTELPQSANIKHYSKQLADQGFTLQNRESKSYQVVDGQARQERKPPSRQINPKGEFTVFNGTSHQVVRSSETVVNPTGEIDMRARIPAKYMTLTYYTDSYVPEEDERRKITLNWNYNSQKYPAKSCEVKMDQASTIPEAFEANFIEKDGDWQPVQGRDGTWSQCTIDGPDEFEFRAEIKDGVLALTVKRNDFWQPNLCGTDG